MKRIYGLSFVAAVAGIGLVCAQPAQASWQLTSSVSSSVLPGSWGSGFVVLSQTANSYSFEDVFDNGYGGESGTFTYTGTVQWVGGGTQPSTFSLSETGLAQAQALYTTTATQTAKDGLGDAATTTYTSSPRPYVTTTSSGSHVTTILIAAGATYTFTRTLSTSSYGGSVNDCYVKYSVSAN